MDGATLIARRLAGFGMSAALHLVMLAAAIVVTSKALPVARHVLDREPVVIVYPDASPRDRLQPDLEIDAADRSGTIALPGFQFDYRKVASRATSLFPFVTGAVSLAMIVAEPRVSLGMAWNRAARAM